MYNSINRSPIADLIEQTSGTSSDQERFYNMIKAYTDSNNGYVSGMDNIMAVCKNEFTPEQIQKFCKSLELTKPGFSIDENPYHGQSMVNTIHIARVYDTNLNRIL
jgi:Ca2+-binding EF-hand superfamily protein